MCRRCIRMLLLVMGCVLLFLAVFPILAFIQVGDAWETAFMASKLVMLPVGAICLLVAATIETSRLPHRP